MVTAAESCPSEVAAIGASTIGWRMPNSWVSLVLKTEPRRELKAEVDMTSAWLVLSKEKENEKEEKEEKKGKFFVPSFHKQ